MTLILFFRQSLAALGVLSLACLSSAHAQVEIIEPAGDFQFGKVAVHSSATQTLKVVNRGPSAVQLGSVISSIAAVSPICTGIGCGVVISTDFTIPAESDGCSNTLLQPGGACSALVRFSPSGPGRRGSQLNVFKPHAAYVSRALGGTGVSEPLDCVLDWAEKTWPQLLTTPTITSTVSLYHLRCCAKGAICVGADVDNPTDVPRFDQPSVYVYDAHARPPLQRLDYLSSLSRLAQCR